MLSLPRESLSGALAYGEYSAARCYRLYGVTLRSEIPLVYPSVVPDAAVDVTLSLRDREWFSAVEASIPDLDVSVEWCECGSFPDGGDFLRWPSLFEFVVSGDGRHMYARALERSTPESFQNYLLGPVLSFALVRQGYEPLHATTVVVDGKAVALLGGSGYGKSTLAASFIRAGHKLLTDDLLMLSQVDGVLSALPGPPRIKLFPDVANTLQPQKVARGSMNPDTDKLMIPLDAHEVALGPAPMHGFVCLDGAQTARVPPRLDRLSNRDALIAIVGATFNTRLQTSTRLQRQFGMVSEWARAMPVSRASYPRDLQGLHTIRDMIVSDVRESNTRS